MSGIEEEFTRLVELVMQRERERRLWRCPPSVIFIKAALYFNTTFIDGAFSSKQTLTQLGVGKSVYAMKTLYHTYNRNWSEAKKYIVFMPQHFLSLFEEAIDKNIRIPAIMWDDASFWIGKMRWQTELVKTIKEFLGVVRTHCAYIIFTAPKPTDIARGIREELNFAAIIRRLYTYHNDPKLSMSRAEYYSYEALEQLLYRGRHVAPFAYYTFRLWFDYYPEYEEMRKQYVKIGRDRMRERLKEIAREAREEFMEIMKKYDPARARRAEPALDAEEIKWGEEGELEEST
jgi:hypothetical protein